MSRPGLFVHPAAFSPAESAAEEDPRLYRPYNTSHTTKQKLTLDLVDRGATIDTLYYPFLLRVRYTPPRLLSLVYFDCVFTLTGRYLDELHRLLRDHLVSEVQVFHAHYHHAPPDHTPLIEKITIEPRRLPEPQSVH